MFRASKSMRAGYRPLSCQNKPSLLCLVVAKLSAEGVFTLDKTNASKLSKKLDIDADLRKLKNDSVARQHTFSY